MSETATTPSLQAVSVPVVVGGVRWLADGCASLSVATTREYSIDELQPLYRLQKQHCDLLLQPEGLATVESPAPEPKKKKAATPSQIQRMLIEQIWEEVVPDMHREEYYENRMTQNINKLQLELEGIRQQ